MLIKPINKRKLTMRASIYLLWIELLPRITWDAVLKKRSNIREAKYKYTHHCCDNNIEDINQTTIYNDYAILHGHIITLLYLTNLHNHPSLKCTPIQDCVSTPDLSSWDRKTWVGIKYNQRKKWEWDWEGKSWVEKICQEICA